MLSVTVTGGCAELVTDLSEYGSIEVQTQSFYGQPVPGVRLTLYTGLRPMATGVTDFSGSYTFAFVPPDVFGVYAAPPQHYVRPEYLLGGPVTDAVDGIDVEEGTDTLIRFTYLKVGPGAIHVSVTEPSGTPVEGARLAANAPGYDPLQGVTGPDGTAVFPTVHFGNWSIEALPPERYVAPDGFSVRKDGLIVEDGAVLEVEMTMDLAALQPCSGPLPKMHGASSCSR